MKTGLFEFNDYKKYLESVITSQPSNGRGFRSRLAIAGEMQLAYLTRVLQDTANLSLEQAQGISKFLGHIEDEQHYFMLLVQMARAGTSELKLYFSKQLKLLKEKRLDLKERFQVKSQLSTEDQALYYSHWYYAAIHVLVSIPGLQTKDAIARALNLPMHSVSKCLEFLLSTGLVVEEKSHYKVGVTRIHLGSDSPFVSRHHTNWRVQAIRSLDDPHESRLENMHYSSVVSLSKSDADKIKHLLAQTMDEFNGVVKDSKEEELRCLCIDFLKV